MDRTDRTGKRDCKGVSEKEVVVENLVDGGLFRVSRSLTEYARRAEFYVRAGFGFVLAGGKDDPAQGREAVHSNGEVGTPGGAE